MKLNFIFVLINICLWIFLVAVAGYVVYLVIKALKKYTRSVPVRKEKAEHAKTLGDFETASVELQNDAGICCRNIRCQPTGGFQVGKRGFT